MRDISIETPPCGALTWPSSDVPAPNGMIGASCAAQMRTTSTTSCVSFDENDGVGRRVGEPGQRMAMLDAHRLGGDELVAETRGERVIERVDSLRRTAAFRGGEDRRSNRALWRQLVKSESSLTK